MTKLEDYYNKFNEEKRLGRRHGQVEYRVTMHFIEEKLKALETKKEKKDIRIIDIGAGTGRYCVELANRGYDVTAVEPVKHNLGRLKAKGSSVKAYQGNALKLKKFEDESFDLTLMFGPMYHLLTHEERKTAMGEACRVTKTGGSIMVAYCMNEYGVLMYGFKENQVLACLKDGRLSTDFHCVPTEDDLYAYMRPADIDELNEASGMRREKIVAVDGAANYMRPVLKAMDEETFEKFIEYQISIAERADLIGASAHTVDILRKQ
ncbi:MAG: methyltransferase domain-containing protein [Lachnospiraceae bacterium]|nr:methyltransferase domain-containing protein [Lachnospiraceae bacterium]